MNVCHTSSHGETLMCYKLYDYVKGGKLDPNIKPCQKLYEIDLDVECHFRFGIINVCDISHNGDTPMC